MRKKILIIALFTLFSLQEVFSQDTIYWSPTYKLKWDDFQGKPDSNRPDDEAVSAINLTYRLTFNANLYKYKVLNYFLKKKAWTRSKENAYLLQHEQIHFNIAELYARRLNEAFKNYVYRFSYSHIKEDFKLIYNKINEEWEKCDLQYDLETDHSKNESKQIEWTIKIQKEVGF